MLKEINSFVDLGLNSNIINVLHDFGYDKPLPIQQRCIPYLLAGYDVLGMAHTGSGKTAAFVLPLLHCINVQNFFSQGLIITPTRELAIQIGTVCFNFTKYMREINVVTLYGGQSYRVELKALKKKPHIVVSTPGRLLDHLNRKTVNLSKLKILVIDEADEMLRMGFIEDVEHIIRNVPIKRQTALFSATLPLDIRKVSSRFMHDPKEVYVRDNTNVCSDIRQKYWLVHGIAKHEALMRFLEIEDFDAAIVFVRTKCATLEVSAILERFGYNSAALNGDMHQSVRHKTLDQLRGGELDIIIATDVAARGLDIHRISLVINYDFPMNSDIYIHRIGRTGRAGRSGQSLLFVERKDYRLLRNIERKIKLNITAIKHPTVKDLLSCRLIKFTKKIKLHICADDLNIYRDLLTRIKPKEGVTLESLAAVLLKLAQGNRPLVLPSDAVINSKQLTDVTTIHSKNKIQRGALNVSKNSAHFNKQCKLRFRTSSNMIDLYRIAVGINDGVKVRHIIGAISNTANICVHNIGNIRMFPAYSIIELPKKLFSRDILLQFSHVRILNKPIKMQFLGSTVLVDGNIVNHDHSTSSLMPINRVVKNKTDINYLLSDQEISH